MKKKRETIGTLETCYFTGDVCWSIEIKSRSPLGGKIVGIANRIFEETNNPIISMHSYYTNDFGIQTLHHDIHCEIPCIKLPQLLKAARAAGFKVK